jgi:hypothetical protein
VQLRLACQLTAEQYVSQRFWESASLPPCPAHPEGGCGFCRHSSYARRSTPGARIARGYCRIGHVTVSLLPDCLASRLPATLAQVERAVDKVEGAGGSVAAAAARMHPVTEQVDHVQSAERRLRRWRRGLYAALVSLAGLMPCKLAGRAATLLGWRTALGADPVLVALRAEAAEHLAGLPPPLGFGPRPTMRKKPVSRLQQRAGPDPPPVGV